MTQTVRHDWQVDEIEALFNQPFNDLMFQAQTVHRQHFDPNSVQISTLLSIKTGACPEDCKYCPQSARYTTGIEKERLMQVETVLKRAAKQEIMAQVVFAWAQRGRIHTNEICHI